MTVCGDCTDCCKVPTLFTNNISPKSLKKAGITTWSRISKRRAKKKNPHLVKFVSQNNCEATYFSCSALGPTGCRIHETKPLVCKGYPVYDRSQETFKELYSSASTEYTEKCNLIETILLSSEEEFEKSADEYK